MILSGKCCASFFKYQDKNILIVYLFQPNPSSEHLQKKVQKKKVIILSFWFYSIHCVDSKHFSV